jgi:hypothetical protein
MENKLNEILKGHLNELTRSEDELYNERIKICEECPLIKHTVMGPVCNSSLYLNPKTDDVSLVDLKNPEYFKGCGCRLNAKTRNPISNCPAGKW